MTVPTDSGEFAPRALITPDTLERRDFVKLMAASMALAGLQGCVREPDRPILAHVDTPTDTPPGETRRYATAMTVDGYATGVLVRSRDGRPIKIDGNPDHPASYGASGIHEQAAVLELYDPHRGRTPREPWLFGSRAITWDTALASLTPAALVAHAGARGAGIRVLMEPTSSPLLIDAVGRFRERYPDARVCFYAPFEQRSAVDAARALFGVPLLPQLDLGNADVVVSFDADVLASGPFHLRHARDFSDRRRNTPTSRLYVAESCPSPTGTLAVRRLAATPSTTARLAVALLDAVAGEPAATNTNSLSDAERAWLAAVTNALSTANGRAVVVAGDRLPVDVHIIVGAINRQIHAVGNTVWYAPSPIFESGDDSHDLTTLAAELASGAVDTLITLEGNPCYTAPVDLELSANIRKVRQSVYLGLFRNETARASRTYLPAAHFLESWGDTRAYDGTASIVQPLIAPLYDGRTSFDVLTWLSDTQSTRRDAYERVRDSWGTRGGASFDDANWQQTLRRGVVDGTAFSRLAPAPRADAVQTARERLAAITPDARTLELCITPSRAIHDGRFADNPWLMELPDPVTKLTWDNAALLAPALAAALDVDTGDVVTLRANERSIEAPVLVVPGHAERAISIAMGYGRRGDEAIARHRGVDVAPLRSAMPQFQRNDVQLSRTGRRVDLAITQKHVSLEGRRPQILGTAAAIADTATPTPGETPPRKRRPLTLYEPTAPSPDGYGADQWAMTIDLDQCTGCSACVVACQAENNIPVVGKDGVLNGREMHWMRIDRYVSDDSNGHETASPSIDVQPMLCQHCEKAPCEYVCPVNATVHSDDGLNEMVYNRCIGTRLCSNNCPYKVRRFNWFDYSSDFSGTLTPVEAMVRNPDVTVRDRGVMEKCTFCVQRIRAAQQHAELAGAQYTGPVETACQQVCPPNAIVFGSLTNPESAIARSFNDPRAFSVLEELGTKPRIRYLARRTGTE